MTPESQALTTKIGLRLRAARKAQQLSLQKLADMTRGTLSKSRVSNYEQGLRRPGIEEARILAQTLGSVSTTYLLCMEDDREFLSDQEQELLRCFRQSDERGRETILRVAEGQCDSSNG